MARSVEKRLNRVQSSNRFTRYLRGIALPRGLVSILLCGLSIVLVSPEFRFKDRNLGFVHTISEIQNSPTLAGLGAASEIVSRARNAKTLPIPLYFEEASIQSARAEDKRFIARTRNSQVSISATAVNLKLNSVDSNLFSNSSRELRIEFPGARSASIEGVSELASMVNHFTPQRRSSGRGYSRLRVSEILRGIDVEYYGDDNGLEFDLILKPGASTEDASLKYSGADSIDVDRATGSLVLRVGDRFLIQPPPFTYQISEGLKPPIKCAYFRRGDSSIGFEVGSYDQQLPLIIDPVLSYSTYLGASKVDEIHGVATDPQGNVYVCGVTTSPDFYSVDALQSSYAGPSSIEDIFVAKLNADGTSLAYSTFLGGHGRDLGLAIAVDSSGCAYITGETSSPDLPTTAGAFQSAPPGGGTNAFIAKLSPQGDQLLYCSYLGAALGNQSANAIAIDLAGAAYITGKTTSTDFPTTPAAFLKELRGFEDAFVVKLDPSGSRLDYSTLLGGTSSTDEGFGIAVDSDGFAYVAGHTASTDFPVTAGAFQLRFKGGDEFFGDAFVTKLNQSGSSLIYSTYLGGNEGDRAAGIALAANGEAIVAGTTRSEDFPAVNAFQPHNASACVDNFSNCTDVFLTRLNRDGTEAIFSTYIGGASRSLLPFQAGDSASGVTVDASGNSYVMGTTGSSDWPVIRAFQSQKAGNGDCFIAKFSPLGALMYSTYLGGAGDESGGAIATLNGASVNPDVWIVGVATSEGFPITPQSLQAGFAGSFTSAAEARDGFVSRISLTPPTISSVEAEGKNMLVNGTGFDDGAVVLLNGVAQKTKKDNDSSPSQLKAKKAVKRIPRGETANVQVQNGDGGLSAVITFKRL